MSARKPAPAPFRVNERQVSDTTDSGATYAIDGLLLETENNNQPLLCLMIYFKLVTTYHSAIDITRSGEIISHIHDTNTALQAIVNFEF